MYIVENVRHDLYTCQSMCDDDDTCKGFDIRTNQSDYGYNKCNLYAYDK